MIGRRGPSTLNARCAAKSNTRPNAAFITARGRLVQRIINVRNGIGNFADKSILKSNSKSSTLCMEPVIEKSDECANVYNVHEDRLLLNNGFASGTHNETLLAHHLDMNHALPRSIQ